MKAVPREQESPKPEGHREVHPEADRFEAIPEGHHHLGKAHAAGWDSADCASTASYIELTAVALTQRP